MSIKKIVDCLGAAVTVIGTVSAIITKSAEAIDQIKTVSRGDK